MSKIDVYTTAVCPYCIAAKTLLKKKGLSYEEIDVTRDQAKRLWIEEQSGQRTVPQIFINGKSIGGFQELSALDRSGELDALLRADNK